MLLIPIHDKQQSRVRLWILVNDSAHFLPFLATFLVAFLAAFFLGAAFLAAFLTTFLGAAFLAAFLGAARAITEEKLVRFDQELNLAEASELLPHPEATILITDVPATVTMP